MDYIHIQCKFFYKMLYFTRYPITYLLDAINKIKGGENNGYKKFDTS